jgi:hypothetical protein
MMFVLSWNAVVSQTKPSSNNSNNKNNMEKLNLNEFTENNPKNTAGKMMTKGDTIKTLIKDDRYFVKERVKNSAFSMVRSYDTSSLAICTEVMLFYGFCTGIGKSYDEKGDVIEEEDYDKDYPFSVEMLIDKCKKEYGIDLSVDMDDFDYMRAKYLSDPNAYNPYSDGYRFVRRYFYIDKYVYDVGISLTPGPICALRRAILIDGSTGEVISDETGPPAYPPGPTGGPK